MQSWFQDRLQECTHKVSCPPNISKDLCVVPESFPLNKPQEISQMPQGEFFIEYDLTVRGLKFPPIFVA